MKTKERKRSLVEDECLACLGYYAYATGRTTRAELVKAFAACTRQDEPTKGSRAGWWIFKFDNIHYAFKLMEGSVVRGIRLPVTKKGGAESGAGLQKALRDYAVRYFLQDLDKCMELAMGALDKPLPADLFEKVFGGVSSGNQSAYGAGDATQEEEQVMEGRKPEGQRLMRMHAYNERASDLPAKAKAAFKRDHGALFCEICGLLPEPTYGHVIVEAHHRLPLSKYAERQKTHTEPSDFAILCPSCHRAVHKELDCDMAAVARKLPSDGIQFRSKKR